MTVTTMRTRSGEEFQAERIAGDGPGTTWQFSGHELLRLADDRYMVHHWTRWPDRPDDWESLPQGNTRYAATWLLTNGYLDEARDLFGADSPIMRDAVRMARFYGIDTMIPRQPWESTR